MANSAPDHDNTVLLDKIDLRSTEYYLNRELTWLAFNRRVLNEARDKRNPLLERLKFIAIVSSNLDEFFMKRIGGLKQQCGANIHALTVDGRTPQQQIIESYALIRELEAETQEFLVAVLAGLKRHNIRLLAYDDLTASQQSQLREYYFKNIFPLVTPQAMDPAHPFPFISNLSLNLLVTLHYPDDTELSLARIKVSVGEGSPRFIQVGEENHFVALEDVISNNLDLLFPGMIINSCETFRVTRNAITERDEDQANDLLVLIESELRDRTFAPIVRLEVVRGMNATRRGMLAAELGLNEEMDVFECDGLMRLRDLMQIAFLDIPELHDAPHQPINHPKLQDQRSIFYTIRDAGTLLLQHPYESFKSSVETFVRTASEDPKVLAIKMTLYRTSRHSEIIKYLINAARNGKRVAVVVELKARFDEAANIRWANHLEQEGIHVTYGVLGLKTHSKTVLVVRQDYSGLRRYAHIGTGNYNAETARIYTDLGILTCDDDIGHDLTEFFNYLTTGYTHNRNYRKLLPSPHLFKRALIHKIDREIQAHAEHGNGLIQFKMNALEDVDVAKALYKASMVGVKINLIVRDTCRIRPGVEGLSTNITIISIVGRFLEHARIYYFHNNGAEEYYIGSADCMKRNLESRVEIIAPVEDPALRQELRYILDTQFNDHRGAWEMQANGQYLQRGADKNTRAKSCQQILIEQAEKRHKEANRLRRVKPGLTKESAK